jgi:hypothetical protein
LRLSLQRRLIGGIDVEPVGVEEDAIAHISNRADEIFLAARHDHRFGRLAVHIRIRRARSIVRDGGQILDFLLAASRKRGAGEKQQGHGACRFRHLLLFLS